MKEKLEDKIIKKIGEYGLFFSKANGYYYLFIDSDIRMYTPCKTQYDLANYIEMKDAQSLYKKVLRHTTNARYNRLSEKLNK